MQRRGDIKKNVKKNIFSVQLVNLKIKLTVCKVRIVIILFSVKKHIGINQNRAPAKEMHLKISADWSKTDCI